MLFFKKRTQQQHIAADRIAGRIAGAIVRRQFQVSAKLNCWINRYPVVRQMQFLWLFCLVSISCIVISLAISMKHTPMQVLAPHYQPAFIGRASDLPKVKPCPILKIDSITNKK